MKALYIIITITMHSIVSYAQFNTITSCLPVYKVKAETDTSKEVFVPAIINSPITEDGDYSKRKIIESYTSVSYPLKQIHINSTFGKRTDPFTGKKAQQHNGLDLSANDHDEVYSMLQGKVLNVGYDKRSGIYVKIQYGNYTVSYCHLSKAIAKKGDIVNAGEIIGQSGSTGRSTGEHLHLTVKYKSKYINPTIMLDYVRETQLECIEKLKELA